MSKVGSITALLRTYASRIRRNRYPERLSSTRKLEGYSETFKALDEIELKLKELLAGRDGSLRSLLPREEIEQLLKAVEQVTAQANELAEQDPESAPAHALISTASSRRPQAFRPLPRLRPISFERPSQADRDLEARIYQGRGDRVAYKVAWRLLKRGKAPDEVAVTVSLPLHEVRRIDGILREEQRRRLDDAAIERQVRTLVDELSIEKIEKRPPQVGYGSGNTLAQRELVIERRQVLL